MRQNTIQKINPETMSYKASLICLRFSLPVIFLLFCLSAFSQADFSQVDNLLLQNQKTLGNNAVALVWKDGKIVYQKQIGDFNAKTQAPIASCSKWLTAALVMMYVDEGKISLDDKISKYIPIYETYRKRYITIRNCLSHTAGIQAEALGPLKLLQKNKYASLEEEVNAFAKKEIVANPGTEFFYSTVGLNIAGRVLEIITKKSFDRLIQEKLLRPLKMRATSFSNDDGGAVNPSGGARSTANDYMNFLVMMLNKGVFEGKRILSEAAVQEMETPPFPNVPVKYAPKIAEGFHYGLGEWILEQDASGKSVVLSSPGLFGTWPYIDVCRHYGAIIFVKSLLGEQKKELYMKIKDAIESQFVSDCR